MTDLSTMSGQVERRIPIFLDPLGARRQAAALQRKGLTLSEIAEEMDCRREAVVHMLYWEKVRHHG